MKETGNIFHRTKHRVRALYILISKMRGQNCKTRYIVYAINFIVYTLYDLYIFSEDVETPVVTILNEKTEVNIDVENFWTFGIGKEFNPGKAIDVPILKNIDISAIPLVEKIKNAKDRRNILLKASFVKFLRCFFI